MAQLPDWLRLREQLGAYAPIRPVRVTGALSAYISHYGCTALFQESDFSIGCFTHQEYELVVQVFKPRTVFCKGTGVVLHGYMDHAALYRPLCLYLVRMGWRVLTYDLPGHGLSAGRRHAIDDFSRYAQQLSVLIKRDAHFSEGPQVLIGQSTGAAIILEYLRQTRHAPIALSILLAPLVRPAHVAIVRFKYRLLHRFVDSVPRTFTANTSDYGFTRFIREQDPLQHNRIPVRWVGAMLAWGDMIEVQPEICSRVTIMQGEADTTVDWQHNLKVLAQLLPAAEVIRLPEARHNLINESAPLQAQVFNEIGHVLAGI